MLRNYVTTALRNFLRQLDLFLFPLGEWRLLYNFEGGKQAGGRITYVRAFCVVATRLKMVESKVTYNVDTFCE